MNLPPLVLQAVITKDRWSLPIREDLAVACQQFPLSERHACKLLVPSSSRISFRLGDDPEILKSNWEIIEGIVWLKECDLIRVWSCQHGRCKMILSKLQEALAEIAAQRNALDEVEAQLRAMIARLSEVPAGVAPVIQPSVIQGSPVAPIAIANGNPSKIDEVVNVLRAEGRPLHIGEICERLSTLWGETVDRKEIEPGLNRHIARTKAPKIAKFCPSTFGLPEWFAETHATGS